MKRACEGTWRDILEWAWDKKVGKFTHNDLLREGVISYRGDERTKIRSASSSLYRMWRAGLLIRLAAGKGRRAGLYAPVSREKYQRTFGGRLPKIPKGKEVPPRITVKKPKVAREKEPSAKKPAKVEVIKTGIPGFDGLFRTGIPKGVNVLIAGGPGTGKTIFCLQALHNAVREGHPCLYITLEELPERLKNHMREFGWDVEEEERAGLKIIRRDPFKIARTVEALLESLKGRLPMDLLDVTELIPKDQKPYMITLDSISALESAFTGRTDSYRIYIEQLFRLFERIGATTFLITETEEAPTRFSRTGVEEFLADGVFVLYYFKVGDRRVRAIEVLKMRGVKHMGRIVPFQISERGMEVFPGERVYEIKEAE